MPVLMGPEGLLETGTLARSLGFPALEEPGGFEYPIGAGGLTATTLRSSIMKVSRR